MRHSFTALGLQAFGYGFRIGLIYIGKERDAESGLDYFGTRYYSSAIGRFLTPDWAAKPTAVPYGDFGDPQSLNLHSYVRNNPLSKTDPDGHCGAPSGLKPGGVGICVASYIQTKWFKFSGRGDNRGPTALRALPTV